MSHGYFIAMSFGATALAVMAELVILRVQRAKALRRIREERDLEAQD
jgi:heme exporter protein D